VKQLYIYWKVAPADLGEAIVAVRRFHSGVGTSAQLLRRSDGQGAMTLMEVYAGLDAARCEELIAEAATALGRFAPQGRHAEIFEPI
jgi:Domain of unknown function (DUF4936)